MSMSFHPGEREVQSRAGVQARAERTRGMLSERMPDAARDFLRQLPFALLGGAAPSGAVWASLLCGPPGFLDPTEPDLLRISGTLAPWDPLSGALEPGGAVGLLAIEPATRRRMRVNGILQAAPDGELRLHTLQVYANCPKYIQARAVAFTGAAGAGRTTVAQRLDADHRRWIESSDTAFIASTHKEGGADVSHRGGAPGFIRILDEGTLLMPDYLGNALFQSLGNLVLDPRVGLLWPGFAGEGTLQISGRAELLWDGPLVASLAGAERALLIRVEQVVRSSIPLPLQWGASEPSLFNP